MSAESPISARVPTRPSSSATVVLPQEVTDPTILDSVAGFLNDVVPATQTAPNDARDQIQWAHFEHLDPGETVLSNFDSEEIIPPPLLLVLGYTTGVQVWAVLANGEAKELLSWHHGSVRVLRILPTPFVVGRSTPDAFAAKRPLIALCDNQAPGGTQFCALSFLSLKTGEQVKLIKFKNPILDVLANKQSIVVTFMERIAVFDAFTLEDRLTVTTCYPSPGLQPNPVALGARWLAFAEKKLSPTRRSSGGCEGEGVQSYTATVIHAAKSLGRGLKEFSETVASSLTGNSQFRPGAAAASPAGSQNNVPQKGIITVLDIANPSINMMEKSIPDEAIIAHFPAHNEAIVCLSFDASGLLLLTADKRGHDFHLFRINPHPAGSGSAAVHHLYILHRGDTTAKVQDMCFSPDARWVTVSTLRGTTHVFAVTPYGGPVGYRTHTSPYVVNKMSRFHRSAGLTSEGRSNSPVTTSDVPLNSIIPFYNPRLPPHPHPTNGSPLAQIRQPVYVYNLGPHARSLVGRQRLTSSSEENIVLRVVATFAPPRAWFEAVPTTRDASAVNKHLKSTESLFIISCHGTLVQYDLDPRPVQAVPRDRVSDDTPIELSVSAKGQWPLQRRVDSDEVSLPLSARSLVFIAQGAVAEKKAKPDHNDDQWLSQVEIVTHAGPHRRLWMGPQFTFKTYNLSDGSLSESRPIDVGRSKPVNMPVAKAANAVFIESSSAGSGELSLLETYHKTGDDVGGAGELQLKEDLADAMQECPGRESGGRYVVTLKQQPPVAKVVNPLGTVVTIDSDLEQDVEPVEDAVIHENCDEALFRPVVTAKPANYAENKHKNLHNDDIIVQSLHQTAEVAVRLVEKKPAKENNKANIDNTKTDKNKDCSEDISDPPAKISKSKIKDSNSGKQSDAVKSSKNKSNFYESKVKNIESKSSKSDSTQYINNIVNLNLSDSIPDTNIILTKETESKNVWSLPDDSYKDLPEKENTYKPIKSSKSKDESKNNKQSKHPKQKAPPADVPDTSMLDIFDEPPPVFEYGIQTTKVDTFEHAKDCEEDYVMTDIADDITNTINYKYQGLDPSEIVEDVVSGEKSVAKKPRKPKSKLGIRIPQNKENSPKPDKTSEGSPAEAEFVIQQPKRSWNIVAASKPPEKNYDSDGLDKSLDLDLPPPAESVEFTIKLPRKSYSSSAKKEEKLIDIETPQEINKPLEDSFESDSKKDLLKDKSSDDEKGDSPVETTESDDSSKIPAPLVDIDEDEGSDKTAGFQASKSSKRKARKKRK